MRAELEKVINDPSFTSMPMEDQNAAVKQMEKRVKLDGQAAVYDYRDAHPENQPQEYHKPGSR